MGAESISLPFVLVAELADALGVRAINALPGCWEHKLDEVWTFAVNGHGEPTAASFMRGKPLEPYHLYVEYNGWPAGYLSPAGGAFAAGDGANGDAFCDALRAAIAKAKGAANV